MRARASPAIGTSRTSLATAITASRSPFEAIGKPASMTSTPKRSELVRHADLLFRVHGEARRLFTVAERGIENADVAHGYPQS